MTYLFHVLRQPLILVQNLLLEGRHSRRGLACYVEERVSRVGIGCTFFHCRRTVTRQGAAFTMAQHEGVAAPESMQASLVVSSHLDSRERVLEIAHSGAINPTVLWRLPT